MKIKKPQHSKEIIISALVIINYFLGFFDLPHIPMTETFVGSIGAVWFVLRGWFTDAKIDWSLSKE